MGHTITVNTKKIRKFLRTVILKRPQPKNLYVLNCQLNQLKFSKIKVQLSIDNSAGNDFKYVLPMKKIVDIIKVMDSLPDQPVELSFSNDTSDVAIKAVL